MGWSFFKEETKLVVTLLSRANDREVEGGSSILTIRITNRGRKAASIKSIKIKSNHGKFEFAPKFLTADNLPYNLEVGEKCFAETTIKELVQQLVSKGYDKKVKVWVDVEDSTNKIHRSMASLLLDIDKLRKKYL